MGWEWATDKMRGNRVPALPEPDEEEDRLLPDIQCIQKASNDGEMAVLTDCGEYLDAVASERIITADADSLVDLGETQ